MIFSFLSSFSFLSTSPSSPPSFSSSSFQTEDRPFLKEPPRVLRDLEKQTITVHQSAKLQSGTILRLKAPGSLPFCDTHFRGRNVYVQIISLFSAVDKNPRALVVQLKDDKRVALQQIRLASLRTLRPNGDPIVQQLSEVLVQVPVVPNFSSQNDDAFLLNHFAM